MERGDTHLCRNEAAPALSFVPNNDNKEKKREQAFNRYIQKYFISVYNVIQWLNLFF